MDNKQKLDKLFQIYQDIELDIICLMKKKISEGIEIRLNNMEESSLFNILHVNDWANLDEYSCFFIFPNNYPNYRKYCHKLFFFEDASHCYEMTIRNKSGDIKTYTKSTIWKNWLKEIIVEPQSTVSIKEKQLGLRWDSIGSMSYLENEYSYYNYIKDKYRDIINHTEDNVLKKFCKRFLDKENPNKQLLVKTFEPFLISKNLFFLNTMAKELIDKKSIRKCSDLYDKLEQPLNEILNNLNNGFFENKKTELPYQNQIKKIIEYENKAQMLFDSINVIVDDRSPLSFSYAQGILFLLNGPEEFLIKNYRSWKNFDIFIDDYYEIIRGELNPELLDNQLKVWAHSAYLFSFKDYPQDNATKGKVILFIKKMKEYH